MENVKRRKNRLLIISLSLSCRFSILQKGPKLLYLNTCIRGYPKGLRAGSDPRKPLISVDEHFEKIEYRNVPSVLFSIEVWNFDGQIVSNFIFFQLNYLFNLFPILNLYIC